MLIESPSLTTLPIQDKGLGDAVAYALGVVGITKERVSSWLGRPCNCKERQERLNRLGAWARRILAGKTEKAKEYLDDIIAGESPPNQEKK